MKRSFLKSLIWICAIVTVLLVSSVAYSQPIVKRYPPICTDVSGLLTAQEEGFIPCSWYQQGTAPGTPTYITNTLATPLYMEIKDWNSNLQLDVEQLANIVAGLANTYQAGVVASASFGYNGVQWLPNLASAGVPHFDLRRINGNTVNTNGGNRDTGTITVAVADDDNVSTKLTGIDADTGAMVTALQIMDDWDSSDHAKTKNVPLVWDSDNAGNCAAITDTSAQMTLDTDSDHFKCCAWGGTAYAITGANPTVTTAVTTGFSFMIADGQCHKLSTADVKIAVMGLSTAGNYCCISLEAP